MPTAELRSALTEAKGRERERESGEGWRVKGKRGAGREGRRKEG